MDQPETTNTHLHKVLTHRNYIHNVSLQKQLNIYDKQKKLVERELLQIHKVREAIQQINKSLPNKSQRFKNRNGTASNLTKRSQYDSSLMTKSKETVQDREEGSREHGLAANGGIKNGENEPIKVNEEELFGSKGRYITRSSKQSFQEKWKVEKDRETGVVLRNKEPHEVSFSNATSEPRSTIEPVKQNGTRRTIDLQSNTVPVDNQTSEKRAASSPETGNPSNENDRKMTSEKYDKNITSQLTGNEKLFTRRPPYMKACSAPSLPVQKLEEAVECEENLNGRCEIYRLQKPQTRMVNKDRYTNCDEDLYRKSLLANHAGTKLPTLTNNGVSDGNANKINVSNFANNAQCLEVEKNQLSITFGASPHSNTCSLVQTSRPRSKTWQNMETLKPKAAWNSPERQKKHKKSPLSTFSNNDVCFIDKSRKRATNICNVDNTCTEYGRPRSKTETCNNFPGCQQRSARDSNWFFENSRPRSVTVTGANEIWAKVGVSKSSPETEYKNKSQSCESIQRLSEDEAIAIKGKFRQIGHSVLATALMKKMIKKTA